MNWHGMLLRAEEYHPGAECPHVPTGLLKYRASDAGTPGITFACAVQRVEFTNYGPLPSSALEPVAHATNNQGIPANVRPNHDYNRDLNRKQRRAALANGRRSVTIH